MLEQFENRLIGLLEKTEETALDEKDPAAVIEELSVLAGEFEAFRKENSEGDSSRELLPMLGRVDAASQAVAGAIASLRAKKSEDALDPLEQSVASLTDARTIAQDRLVKLNLQQQLIGFQQAVDDAGNYMADVVDSQKDMIAATAKADEEELKALIPAQRNLHQCLTDIAPYLDIVAERLDVGTPLVFAASDVEDALAAMEDGDAEDAADIQETAVASLDKVRGMVAEIAVQTGYISEIVGFLHQTESEGAQLAYRQRKLREQRKPGEMTAAQEALTADARRYGEAIAMVAGRVDFQKLDEAVRQQFEGLDLTLDGITPAEHMTAALRQLQASQPAADRRKAYDNLVRSGGDTASGPELAAASLLALDVADRGAFQRHRERIIADHTEHPMMWSYAAFLLDRNHRYWMFQVPFVAGWSYGRREEYFLAAGDADEGQRMLRTEFQTEDGKTLRIPEDLDKPWTMILFSQPAPWSTKKDDGLPESPERFLQHFTRTAATRPCGDLKVLLATFGGDAAASRAALLAGRNKIDCPVVSIPGGAGNPLIQRLGILSEDRKANSALIRKDGRIIAVVSGLGDQTGRGGVTLDNVLAQQDEMSVSAALDRGDIQAAKEMILALAPPFDPNAVDAKGRKPPKINHNTAHLRARARVHIALKEYDKALADAEEVVQRQLNTDGGMSLRTDELDESEALRDSIKDMMKEQK
jgi:hypothetical protein